jgi:hypothetical protein
MHSFTGFTLFFAALNLSIGAVLSVAFHTFVWPNLMAGAVMAIAAACLHILGSPLKTKARQ